MNARSAFPTRRPKGGIAAALRKALTESALPGETDALSSEELDQIVALIIDVAAKRAKGAPAIQIQSSGTAVGGQRRMRLVVVNDDMPFLVDSVAQAVAAHNLDVSRLLHPIVAVQRAPKGALTAILPDGDEGGTRESIIFMEIERADARKRRELEKEILSALADVRAAVEDWPLMREALQADAEAMPFGEGAALLRWFLENNLTQLGYQIETADGSVSAQLGVLRTNATPLWSANNRSAAFAWFAEGHDTPLIIKAGRLSEVHRRVPMDLIIVPHRKGKKIQALSIHAALWTSAALKASSDKVPVLRARLASIEEKYGFAPRGHAGKALRHVLSSLPHDLLIGFDAAAIEHIALTAMSLADRPRPKLVLVPGALKRHLFVFVWLSRDELSTARRQLIGSMLQDAARAPMSGWAMELGDGDLALMRFTFDLPEGARIPDEDELDQQIGDMLRGWAPAVEEALTEKYSLTRATRLALSWAQAFPAAYRERYHPREAARDISRLAALAGPESRGARFYKAPTDRPETVRLKIYRSSGLVMLSDAVPVLENFGFSVLKEVPTRLSTPAGAQIYEFMVSVESDQMVNRVLARAEVIEGALAAVLEGKAENDAFNQLITAADLKPDEALLFRAWFRYMRQAGLAYGLQTVVDALKRAPQATRAIIGLFKALHDPARRNEKDAASTDEAIDAALVTVSAIDDDRILRWMRAFVKATLRTNVFVPAGQEALAFKIDSALVPGLPAPVPWREIWIYSPRVEGIHLRGGPIARGGLRWSDRRDDFRTEILGLMKAQVVKNAVIVPTGAKGGFYPKQLPPASDRDAWLAEGTESYRIFIRALLSVTDNIVKDKVVQPEGIVTRDDADPYFVVAADKGTAAFSDVANAIAIEHGFWLGDAFASGGSQGYDHKAMGITARGAWISVQRHLAEMGVDIQKDAVRVAGCGDMSGDVFGNGMLLSKSIQLVAAFDHRHIFLDPDPNPAKSWKERGRLFALPRSSWADYNEKLISRGGGIFPRSQKSIPLSPEIKAMLDISEDNIDPSSLIAAILRSRVDLIWFGGIGTYIKAQSEANSQVGDPANDTQRINGEEVRARVIGEGANLGVTQAGRISFAARGGRINTDFIDNSAGVDCSDNEVNIKIPLNREMVEGRLSFEDRNAVLKEMTDEVAALVLEDNRLQTLALSLSESDAAASLSSHIRVIEILETQGRLNRAVEGLASNDILNRRAQEGRGLTRPELAVLLSHSKLAMQAGIEQSDIPADALLTPLLMDSFPSTMREKFKKPLAEHRLRNEIIATELANHIINRLGFVMPFELAEEEGVGIAQVAGAYAAVDEIFAIEDLWETIERAQVGEDGRLILMRLAGSAVRRHLADILRSAPTHQTPSAMVALVGSRVRKLNAAIAELLRLEAKQEADALRARLLNTGADITLIDRIASLEEQDGVIGNAMLSRRTGMDEVAASRAYVGLGEALGLDWARVAVGRIAPTDSWERLLVAGLARDFEQLRLNFLGRMPAGDPVSGVNRWLEKHDVEVTQFRAFIERAKASAAPTTAMLAQVASQARLLLDR
jgi:glutamate dehydrogenase